MGSRNITCSNCGTSLHVPEERIPEGGGWGKCTACGHRLFLEPSPDRAPEATFGQPEVDYAWSPPAVQSTQPIALQPVKETVTSPATALFVRTPGGKTMRWDPKEVRERIRAGHILPWDLVSADGKRFEPIQKNPDYSELLREFAFTAQKNCWNHLDRVSEKICARCQRTYCSECLQSLATESALARACFACAGVLQETDPGWRKEPYWKRLKDVLVYPQTQSGWAVVAGLALILWLARSSAVTMWLYLASIPVVVYVMMSSAKGTEPLTVSLGEVNIPKWLERSAISAALVVVMALPFILIGLLLPFGIASVLSFLLGLVVFGYHAMALAVAVFSGQPFSAFRPPVIIEEIQRMLDDYVVLLLGLLALDVVTFIVSLILSYIPFVGGLLASAVLAYSLVLGAHMIGWTFYLNLRSLGWQSAPIT